MRALALGLALALAGCGVGQVASTGAALADAAGASAPVTYADRSTLDEKGAIAAETAFTLAAKAATLAIRAGVISDPTTIVKVGALRQRAYTALLTLRAAYRAGNAASYSAAFREFNAAISSFNEVF